jgi:hypothetical protein
MPALGVNLFSHLCADTRRTSSKRLKLPAALFDSPVHSFRFDLVGTFSAFCALFFLSENLVLALDS